MKKIIITNRQYNDILLREQNERLITDSNSEVVLEEGFKDVVLGVALLMGINLSGLNKANAQKAVADTTIMSQIKSTLENEEKTKELSKAFSEKGLENPDDLLAKNADKIVDKFNELAEDNDMSYRVSQKVVDNLESLSKELKKGYALKKSDIETDTIQGIEQTYIVTITDTIDINFDNDNLFVSGQYTLSQDGLMAWNAVIDSIKANGGVIVSANIESSTDAESVSRYKTDYDNTGNLRLAELRSNAVIEEINKINGSIRVTHREIPNNGSDVVSSRQFAAARNNKELLKSLRDKTAEFRYVKVSFVVEFTQEVVKTVKPEEIVKNYRFELAKIIDTDKKTFKPKKGLFKGRTLRCKTGKKGFGSVNCTFSF